MFQMIQRRKLLVEQVQVFYEGGSNLRERLTQLDHGLQTVARIPRNQTVVRTICLESFVPGHVTPQEKLPMRHLHEIIHNYEALYYKGKGMVPDASFWRVERLDHGSESGLPSETSSVRRKKRPYTHQV